jgi:pimeloyl-ACP methyl ester carboxylesterase
MFRIARIAGFLAIAIVGLACAGMLYQACATRRDHERFPPPGKLIDIGGRRLHLRCVGEGSPTVMLEAGGTGDSQQYAVLLGQLAPLTRVCAYDRAGMGWSDPSPLSLTARALANDLDALLTRAALPPPYVLVARSGGGPTVELYAREHADTVKGLLFLDAIDGSAIDALSAAVKKMTRLACAGRLLAHLGVLRLFDLRHQRGHGRNELDAALTYRTDAWDAVCSLVRSSPESAAQLRNARPLSREMPLVVVRHERVGDLPVEDPAYAATLEPIWQAEQAKLAACSSRGRLIVATGSGHHVADERPELVLDELRTLVGVVRRSAAR